MVLVSSGYLGGVLHWRCFTSLSVLLHVQWVVGLFSELRSAQSFQSVRRSLVYRERN